MKERESQDDTGGLWIPRGGGQPPAYSQEFVNEINSVVDAPKVNRHDESHWTLHYPIEMGGLLLKTSMVYRQTPSGEKRQTYSLHVTRAISVPYPPGVAEAEDVGCLTREELHRLYQFIGSVLVETES